MDDVYIDSVTCDASNNSYADELRGVVCVDFRFRGVKEIYRLEFTPQEGTSFAQLRQNLFETLHERLSQYTQREIADDIMHLRIVCERAYAQDRKTPRRRRR